TIRPKTGREQANAGRFELMPDRASMAAPSDAAVRSRVLGLPRRLRSETVNGLAAEWELRIDDQVFTVTVGGHSCQSREGPATAPNTTIWVDGSTWLAIDSGTLTGPEAFLQRRLKLAGNLDLAVRLQTLFKPYRRARNLSDLDQVEVEADGITLSAYMVVMVRPVVILYGLDGSMITRCK